MYVRIDRKNGTMCSTHLISVSGEMKVIAYLIDLMTIRICDLVNTPPLCCIEPYIETLPSGRGVKSRLRNTHKVHTARTRINVFVHCYVAMLGTA